MRKLIHSKFEIILSFLKITDTIENNWFSDNFFSRISLPFGISLTDELNQQLDFISEYNTAPETLYKVKYQDDDEISDAEFEILEEVNSELQCTYETGLDEFATWNKRLEELPLLELTLPEGTTIYEHAASMVGSTFPAVDYCFPAVHVDEYDTDDGTFGDFKKIVNLYQDGEFVTNWVDVLNVSHIRNIMHPAVFWLYILRVGFQDAGFLLAGDIINDAELKKTAVFAFKENFRRREPFYVEIIKFYNEYSEVVYMSDQIMMCNYYFSVNLEIWGEYTINGTITTLGWFTEVHPNIVIFLNGNIIWARSDLSNAGTTAADVEQFFVTEQGGVNELVVYVLSGVPTGVNDVITYVMDLGITLVDEYDQNGDSIPVIENLPVVNLKKAVPDMTFGEFVKLTKNWFNYDFTPVGNTIYMNQIQKNVESNDPMDLQFSEIRNPIRKFKKGTSFYLKFADIESKVYKYDNVFHSAAGVITENIVTDTKTSTIEINAIPLPQLNREGIETAHAFEISDSRVLALQYTGLRDGVNTTGPTTNLLLPAVHFSYWKKWFDFRIKSVGFKWLFRTEKVNLDGLHIKREVYAYKHSHLIKSMTRTEIEPNLYEIEIETEAKR